MRSKFKKDQVTSGTYTVVYIACMISYLFTCILVTGKKNNRWSMVTTRLGLCRCNFVCMFIGNCLATKFTVGDKRTVTFSFRSAPSRRK